MYGTNPSQQMNGAGPARSPYQPVRVPQNMQGMNPMLQSQMRGMQQGGMGAHPRQMYGNPGNNPYSGVMSTSHFPTSSPNFGGMQRSGMSMPDGGMKSNSMAGMQQHPQYPGGDYGHMSRPSYSGQPTMSYSTNTMQHMQRPPSQGGMYGGPGYGGVPSGGQMSHMAPGGPTMNASNKGELPSQPMASNIPSYSSMQQSLPQKQQLPTVATGSYMQRTSMHGDNLKQAGYYTRLPNSNQPSYPSGYPSAMPDSAQRMNHPSVGMVRMQPPSGSHSSGQMHSGYPGQQTRFDSQSHQNQYVHSIPQTVSPRQNIPPASPHLQSPALPQSPAGGSASRSRISSQQGGQTSMSMKSPRPYDNKGPMSPRMNYSNQSPHYQNNVNYNQISQSPNANATNSYGGRFLSPNSGVNTTMGGVPTHQSAQSNVKSYGGNTMQMQHMGSNASGGQQYPSVRMPEMQSGYSSNQWGSRRPSPMQSPPNMMQNLTMQQPSLSSPQSNQMPPRKSSSSMVGEPGIHTNISNKPLQDSSIVNTDFSLDSLLVDPMDSGGSFMQQLQEINSNNTSVNSNDIVSSNSIDTPVQNQSLQSVDQMIIPARKDSSINQSIPIPSVGALTNQSRRVTDHVAQNVQPLDKNLSSQNKIPEDSAKSNMGLQPPHRLPTLENINFNSLDSSNNKQDIPPISQTAYSSASISSSLTNPFTTTSTTATSNMTATKESEVDNVNTTQAIFTPVTSTLPVQTTAIAQPPSVNEAATSKTLEMRSPENKLTPKFSSPTNSVSSIGEQTVQPAAAPTSSQPNMTHNFPPKPQQDFYNEASSNVAANPPISQQMTPCTAPPAPFPNPGMGSPPHQQLHYSNPSTVSGKPVPNSMAVVGHPQAQVNMQNRMPHPMQQGSNYRPVGPMDVRMPNQMPPHGPERGMQPPGYRLMGPQPGMPPNSAYPQHSHVPPGQPGPRPYPYPRPPYNPNMPPQMNYMPRPGVMRHEMGGPMPYGPQGMPPHIHQQHQHLQMLERDIQNFQMQLRSEQIPARVEEINRRLVELENRRHHIINQLHRAQSGQMPGIELKTPPVGVMPPNADETKKKRLRQKKEQKIGDNGEIKDKPPKKKKKKEVIPGIQKSKKKKDDGDDAAYMPLMSEPGSDSSMPFSQFPDGPKMSADPVEGAEDPTYALPVKRKKKPPATTIKPNKKKKRKRGEESDEEHSLKITPPPSPEDSYIEKRRSSRNVKRKRYTESIEMHLSDDALEPEESELLKQQQQAVKQDTGTDEDQLIVDKVLGTRIRKVPIYRSPTKEAPSTKPADDEEKIKPESSEGNENTVTSTSPSTDNNKNASIESATSDTVSLNKQPTVEHQNKPPEPEIVGYNDEEEFLLKFKNFSYLHCEWKTMAEIGDKRADAKIKRYKTKQAQMNDFLQYENEGPFNPDFTVVDRVLDVSAHGDEQGKMVKHYLVKWCALPYEDSTWESEESVDNIKIREFERRCAYRPHDIKMMVPPKHMWHKLTLQDSFFKNENQLRDYQLEGISWLLFNWYNRRNCILADEMGLGKTIQSITFLQKIFDHGIQGPFLIVAPLSTIANWQREFESWTDINAVVYHGSQTSRDMINTYEFYCRDENLDEIPSCYKLHAVITTYEMIVLENSHLSNIDWRCLIIDEAHRLKNRTCKLSDCLNQMSLEFKVLLTGTPLQNNIEELFALLNFLQPDTFNSEQAFSHEFGMLKDNSQVLKLQELLKPMMLRRLKEDVEKSIAPKEETIIEVELTNIQKKYYRAILERNFEFLAKGTTSGNVPNLMNTMMELRKCCNHPYLIKGAEDKIQAEYMEEHPGEFNSLQVMIQSAGKLVLIDKLLPKLKANGHKVLVFSQMVKCLDILEDYLMQNQYFYERIDGCVRGNDRQMAIDRFSRPGSDRFVFLLCTRAGGLGINLTAADTVIIFDSDWNPQNDLQAQARCHRIGQQKSVKVYRLITRNSYEREMFDKASLKLGLDKAVLQSISGRQDQSLTQQPALSKHEVEDLLKRGAYGAIMDDDDAANKFCEEDIDSILQRRAHTITIESEKGSTFSKASFVSAEDRTDISLDDPNFWEKWAKKADLDLDRMSNNKLIMEQPRRRKQTRRFGGMTADDDVLAEIGSESDSDYEDRPNTRRQKNKSNKSMWSRRDCFRVIKSLLTFGWGRWKITLQKCGFQTYVTEQDLEEICRVVLIYCLKFYNGDEKIKLFIWDLITPAGHASINGIDFKNHEGLSAPVPRGRKGRKVKDDPERKQQLVERDWAKDIKVDSILQDDGFKKHLQHQCNKVLLRIRTLYYLRTEILGPYGTSIEEGAPAKSLDIEIPEKVGDRLTAWWDAECDKSLLIGVYKHGYEKYNLIRADPSLCFLEKVGRPDEKAIAAELEVDNDGDAGPDPEYKPAKVVFNDYSEFEDSPTPNTPNTEPASPADNDSMKKSDDKDLTKSDSVKEKLSSLAADWPLISELNMRMRRLITCFQKHYKLMQARMMNLERRNMRRERMSESPRYRKEFQARWTRREETDFYRTISTFGVEYNDKGNLTWSRFRNIAKLDRKSDDSLRMYYLAFKGMCERVCGRKNPAPIPKEALNIQVDLITEERASRTLYRLHILDKIRKDVLRNKHFSDRMEKCQTSSDLPVWWVPVKHDKELLLGMDRHGLTRTDIHILNDPTLSFLQSMRDFENKPLKEQALLLNMLQHGSEISERINNAAQIDINDLEKRDEEEIKPKEKVKKELNLSDIKQDVEKEETLLETTEDKKEETLSETTEDKKEETLSDSTEDKKEETLSKTTEDKHSVPDDKTVSNDEDHADNIKESDEDNKSQDIKTAENTISDKNETNAINKEELNNCENIQEGVSEKIDNNQENNNQEIEEKYVENDIATDKPEEEVAKAEITIVNEPPKEKHEAEANEQTSTGIKNSDKSQTETKIEEGSLNDNKNSEEKELEKEEGFEQSAKEEKLKTTDESDKAEEENSEDKVKNEVYPPSVASSSEPLFLQQPLSIKWPKDRILVQRVEHLCHLVSNGEWPTAKESRELNQTPTMFAESAASSPMDGSTSRGMDSPRHSPVPSKMHQSAGALTAADLVNLNPLMMSENELIAAMLQMQQATKPTYGSSSRNRGRRKKKHNYQSISPTRGQNSRLAQAAEQHAKDQQELQRRLEEMYLLNSFAHTQASSSSKGHKSSDNTDFFPDLNTIKQSMLKGSSKEDMSLGNSSASLLAKLQELATSKPEKEYSQEQLLREAHKQAKQDSKSRSSDYRSISSSSHSQHQAMDNPFQLPPEILASFPFNQLLQESLKSGNPNNLFPLLMDPNFILNESAKLLQQQSQSQSSSSSSKLTPPTMSQADMSKLFQSMPDLAALGLFPPGLFPQFPTSMQKPNSSKKVDKAEKSSRSKDTLSSKIQSLEMANEQALQSLNKEFLDKHIKKDSKSETDKVSPNSSSVPESSKVSGKSPARKASKLDAMFGALSGGKASESSPKSSSRSKKSKKSKFGFISPAVLPQDIRIPVHHAAEGKKYSGEDAPLNKDLADWLKQNPGFVVDYQVLRQQLDESSDQTPAEGKEEKSSEPSKPAEKVESSRQDSPTLSIESESSSRISTKSPSLKHKHKSSSRSSTPAQNRTHTPAKNSDVSPLLKPSDAAMFAANNPFANLPPNFMNSFQGLPPDFAALVASGLMPGIPGMPFPKMPGQDMDFNQSPSSSQKSSRSNQKESSRRKDKSDKEYYRSKDRQENYSDKAKDGRQSSSSNYSRQDAMAADAFAAALGAGMIPGAAGLMSDPVQLLAAMQASGMQMDPKALASAGLPMLPFMGGMPGVNPLFPGFMSPEAAAAAMEGLSSSSKRESSDHSSNSELKKYSSQKESSNKSLSKSSSSSSKTSYLTSMASDPFSEALMAMQMSGGNMASLAGNPFLHPSQAASMMMPPMMGMNNMAMPDMFSTEALLQAQLAALSGAGGLHFPMDLKPPSSSSSTKKSGSKTSHSSSKSEGRSKSKEDSRPSSGKGEEEPMDLTQH